MRTNRALGVGVFLAIVFSILVVVQTQAGAPGEPPGGGSLVARVAALEAAVAALQAQVNAQQSTITVLQSNLTAVQATITTLQTALNAETTARQAADSQLQANWNAESQARQDGDNQLQGQIDTLQAQVANLQNQINAAPPDISVRVSNSVEVTIPSGLSTATVLTFDTEEFDEGELHDPLVDAQCLKPPIAGKYLVYFQVQWEGNSNGHRQLTLHKETPITTLAAVLDVGAAQGNQQIVATHAEISEGDYVLVSVAQDSGTPLKVLSVNGSQTFGMVKVP